VTKTNKLIAQIGQIIIIGIVYGCSVSNIIGMDTVNRYLYFQEKYSSNFDNSSGSVYIDYYLNGDRVTGIISPINDNNFWYALRFPGNNSIKEGYIYNRRIYTNLCEMIDSCQSNDYQEYGREISISNEITIITSNHDSCQCFHEASYEADYMNYRYKTELIKSALLEILVK
jgi:hypothetical protein